MADAAERIGASTKLPWTMPGRAEGVLALTEPPAPHNVPSATLFDPIGPVECRTMVVGRGTSLSGEIKFCDRLVIEGDIEASLHECRELSISASGKFKGNAATTNAEIEGRFIGDLLVRKRLVIGAQSQIFGTVTYAEIEVQRGARISGILMLHTGEANS